MPTNLNRVIFTEEMRKDYTILCPQMAPIHFDLLVKVFHKAGYNLELLPSVDHGAVDAGLKYVNNDICYPSILVTGQIMERSCQASTTPTNLRSSSRKRVAVAARPTISRSSEKR